MIDFPFEPNEMEILNLVYFPFTSPIICSGGLRAMSILFFWLLWGVWIFSTFLMGKCTMRTRLMFGILVIIIMTSFSIHLYLFEFNAAWFILLLWGYSVYKRLPFFKILSLLPLLVGGGVMAMASAKHSLRALVLTRKL